MLECSQTYLPKGEYNNARTLLTKLTFGPEELVFVASDVIHKTT